MGLVSKLVWGSWRALGRSALGPRVQNLLIHDTFSRDITSKIYFSFPQPTASFGHGALNKAKDDNIDVYDSMSHMDNLYAI